ncbi:biotin-dependent carboxylase-like protein [Saccharomonospora marina XMU15]|uniref:Biotin-dependent carboxylase-like protein n=1 Tax=Saccharomonospora marina XMU15 TaxID=882083 RepID=H5X6J7_9PSEU|nr:biotin-dependent carboxylase-like protein [Saccharomonospora marina XMU15]
MRVHPYGEQALLVDVADFETVLGLHAALTENPPAGVTDLVPGARTVLVCYEPWVTDASTLTRRIQATTPVAVEPPEGDLVTLPVVYDGEDLAEVSRLTGLDIDEVTAAHAEPEYVVRFGGFAPGFAYLTGLDPRLHVPRRPNPRPGVPAGAVAIADAYTGVYPQTAPGGWQLLGRTDVALWDPHRRPQALLRPGARVRFDPVTHLRTDVSTSNGSRPTAGTPVPGDSVIEVVEAGGMSTVQDLGRHGMAQLGIGHAGAADPRSARLANRLVGNPDGAACLELTFGGLALRFHRAARVAVTGAPCPISREGYGEAMNTPFAVAAGEQVVVGKPATGVRTYISVRGGIGVPQTLSSRSTDVRAGLGPTPLTAGDVLPIGTDQLRHQRAYTTAPVADPPSSSLIVRITAGPRAGWFAPDALDILQDSTYVVSQDSDRTAVRLRGPALRRSIQRELPSEGMVPGAIQVPHSGQPQLLLADHPVTDGYPVLAVVTTEDLPVVAQARPGQHVSFQVVN